MTAYRHTTPDAEAAQYQPTPTEPLTFSDRPEWLETLIETGALVVRPAADGELPYLALQASKGVELVAPADWVVRDRWGNVSSVPPATFAADFDLFETSAATA